MALPNSATTYRTATAAGLHVEPIRPALRDAVLGGLIDLGQKSAIAIYLDGGELTVERENAARRIFAPCLVWMPFDRRHKLRARAGSSGGYMIIGEATLTASIGRRAEAADLRMLASNMVHLGLEGRRAVSRDAARCLDIILREANEGEPGAEAVIEAQVKMLLILLWRHSAAPSGDLMPPGAASSAVLMRFRQSVETHFRDRWTVARHARELGVSPDRLHDACVRALARPPRQLIRERLNHEAQLLLERSSQTIDQIAAHLGFRSASQFSAFFRTINTMPPGAYRSAVRRHETEPASFADWP